MAINQVTVSGNLTANAELYKKANCLSFTIACIDRRRNPETEKWEDVAHFFDCVLFGKRAEALQEYLLKGSKVCIQGKLRYSTWEDKEGNKRSKVSIVVNEVDFMTYKPKQQAKQDDEPIPFY